MALIARETCKKCKQIVPIHILEARTPALNTQFTYLCPLCGKLNVCLHLAYEADAEVPAGGTVSIALTAN